MQNIIIVGNSKGAKTLYGYICNDIRYNIVAFSVDNEYIEEKQIFGLPVTPIEELEKNFSIKNNKILLGIGYTDLNCLRQKIFSKLKKIGYEFETYIHPSATILNNYNIGEGSMIFAGSVLEPFVTIGKNSLIWANCVIAHNSIIGDNCWIASKTIVSADAKIENNSFIGINCTISNNVIISEKNIIGAGALITKNTKPNEVYLNRMAEKHRFDAENYSKYYLK